MMKARLSAMTFLATTLFFAVAAAGEPPGREHHRAPDRLLERDLETLGLDAAQMERVRPLLDTAKQRRREARPELRAAFERMHELLEAEPADEAAVMQQVDKIGALKTEEHKAMLRTLLAVRAELTAEQRQQLKEMSRQKGPPPWHRKKRGGSLDDEG